jgi:hypothetical protein
VKAACGGNEHRLHEAFTDMSVLFLQAWEEVHIVSEQLREESQATRSQSGTLQAHCAQLRLAQFLPPPPGERRQAESEILNIFKHGTTCEQQEG